ncbi:molybdopterin synthase sulfur carrier subunit [Biomphalaria glabrata]
MAYGSERVTCLVSLLFFAKSRELVGQKEVQLQVPSACTGKQLLDHIVLFYPELSLISNNLWWLKFVPVSKHLLARKNGSC